ncbi:Processing alpha glucosidase I [Kickxella alabastrina]|uniref:Processing alpha glucosidase I n=1 Tax=Kickxella alabastrina TaxID=61397 RepID=A0ACC1IT00_9FUNG|nr:Processing alpha glucosidase I [Kickxella alabastrina]
MRILGALAISVWTVAAASSSQAKLDQAHVKLDTELQWGTYRPNLYFGTRPRLPDSLLSGLMWFGLDDQRNWQSIRHSCELGDNLDEYGYSRHNGRDFGEQTMRDGDQGVEIKSEFVKKVGENGGSWAVRFTGRTLNEYTQGVALMYYFGLEGNGTMSMKIDEGVAKITGKTDDLGRFNIRIVPSADNKHPPVPSSLRNIPGILTGQRISGIAIKAPKSDIWRAKDLFQKEILTSAQAKASAIIKHTGSNNLSAGSLLFGLDNVGLAKRGKNLFFTQIMVHGEFSFDVIYECADKSAQIDSNAIAGIASERREAFDRRFEATFGLREKGFDEDHIEMARNALSSLVGGIGFFHGSSLVSNESKPEYGEGDSMDKPQLSKPYSLFTATPSRPFFPRGFLWDEGFHQLVLGQWDSGISMEIIRSWFNTMDSNGWIAREQILGEEARSKVPEEFQVQYPNFANPPTLLFAIEKIADLYRFKGASNVGNYFDHLEGGDDNETMISNNIDGPDTMRQSLPELAQYSSQLLNYFQTTQAGSRPMPENEEDASPAVRGYRWQGRTMDHTLTSGIDDYPRARPPSTNELHVDLFAWITYMVSINAKLGSIVDGRTSVSASQPSEIDAQLESHIRILDEIHWNENKKMYCDVTAKVREDYDELEDDEETAHVRVFVCHRGYISLFPMLLGLVPPESEKLGHILNMIENPKELWTDYGLRSLSKSDKSYGKGENYWRGPIWLNINYLVLSSLNRNYVSVSGPHQQQAQRIYSSLRSNLINNVFSQYQSTRFFWEQYNPKDGSGQGTHPFTGWTTLILPIMAESY